MRENKRENKRERERERENKRERERGETEREKGRERESGLSIAAAHTKQFFAHYGKHSLLYFYVLQ